MDVHYSIGEIYTRNRPNQERRLILDISNNIILYRIIPEPDEPGTTAGGGIETDSTKLEKQISLKRWNEWAKYATKES